VVAQYSTFEQGKRPSNNSINLMFRIVLARETLINSENRFLDFAKRP
jgi:hypothetical protein